MVGFSSRGWAPSATRRAARRRALELGVNYVDTSPSYSIARPPWARPCRRYPALSPSTKLSRAGRRAARLPFNAQYKGELRRMVETSLATLRRDRRGHPINPRNPTALAVRLVLPTRNASGPCVSVGRSQIRGDQPFTAWAAPPPTIAPINAARDVRCGVDRLQLKSSSARGDQRRDPRRHCAGYGDHHRGSPLQQGAAPAMTRDRAGAPDVAAAPRAYKLLYAYSTRSSWIWPSPPPRVAFVLSTPRFVHAKGARSVARSRPTSAPWTRGRSPTRLLAPLDEIAALVPFRPLRTVRLPFGRRRQGPVGRRVAGQGSQDLQDWAPTTCLPPALPEILIQHRFKTQRHAHKAAILRILPPLGAQGV
jgi:hypothetical protein